MHDCSRKHAATGSLQASDQVMITLTANLLRCTAEEFAIAVETCNRLNVSTVMCDYAS